MSKAMGIYVKFALTTHQIWSCYVTLPSNSENFYFSPNSILKFRKSYQIWGKLAQEQKMTGKKQIGGWKTPLPSAYRVKGGTLLQFISAMNNCQGAARIKEICET